MKNKLSQKLSQKGFSLIELSIVVLVIGILIVGVIQGSNMMKKAKLNTARSLTQSSPVMGIKDLEFWLETTSEKSFKSTEVEDGSYITTWYNINQQNARWGNPASSGSNRPTYKEKCINDLPCLNFTDSNSSYLDVAQQEVILNKMTIFTVFSFKTFSGTCCTSIFSTNGWTSKSFHFIATDNNTLRYSVNGTSEPGSAANSVLSNKIYIADVVDDTSNVTFYFNGSTSASESFSNSYKKFDNFSIGSWNDGGRDRFFDGYLSEIIIFSRDLKDEERKSIEKYLGQKWGIVVSS